MAQASDGVLSAWLPTATCSKPLPFSTWVPASFLSCSILSLTSSDPACQLSCRREPLCRTLSTQDLTSRSPCSASPLPLVTLSSPAFRFPLPTVMLTFVFRRFLTQCCLPRGLPAHSALVRPCHLPAQERTHQVTAPSTLPRHKVCECTGEENTQIYKGNQLYQNTVFKIFTKHMVI